MIRAGGGPVAAAGASAARQLAAAGTSWQAADEAAVAAGVVVMSLGGAWVGLPWRLSWMSHRLGRVPRSGGDVWVCLFYTMYCGQCCTLEPQQKTTELQQYCGYMHALRCFGTLVFIYYFYYTAST